MKTFSSIYIDEKFLLDINDDDNILDKFHFNNENIEDLKKGIDYRGESINSKVIILESALDDCINKENYEAAATRRDAINKKSPEYATKIKRCGPRGSKFKVIKRLIKEPTKKTKKTKTKKIKEKK